MGIVDYLKEIRILAFLLLIALFAILDIVYGIHLGIDFAGGVQIPVLLEHSVSQQNMSIITGIITQRISSFGLSNPSVYGQGGSEIIVQLPNASNISIQRTIRIIENQGIFQGIVGGKEAINGTGIIGSSVSSREMNSGLHNVTWQVSFLITPNAAVRFSKVALGQGNQPLYLFLDRPTNSIILINSSYLSNLQTGVTKNRQMLALQEAVALGNQSLLIETLNSNMSNLNTIYSVLSSERGRYSKIILSTDTPQFVIDNISALNYTVTEKSPQNMTPVITASQTSTGAVTAPFVTSWPAIGLLSAPILQPSVADGSISQNYQISGPAPSNMTQAQQLNYSVQEGKTISSILKGGSLPVQVTVGAPITIPPTLGKRAALISGIAALLSVIAVTIVIVVRYKKLFLIGPIILTTLGELFIIASILGLAGGIDLAAVAGMIAVVGTGVDAQIIISDELLVHHSSEEGSTKSRLSKAFYIIWADAALLFIAMVPLFFSTSLTTVVGFAESTIAGALLGAFVTRPAYGSILAKHYSK